MLFWIVLVVVVVLALVVLGVVAYGTLGAFGRLNRELAAAERDVAPVRAELQQSVERAARLRDDRTTAS
ncbi:hypothetical protein [Blastococcus xanthinilyticus]|uniref:Uncharacterized protein n=1 Tax=Blastococcus xanthinilyticus TaxID=1564164 RepID=A0A5S5D3C3_9ACTN|nr:hypothetical protein [Blastococcus xanthinilyticus]TYP89119.1 hypothetical protein BD833_103276 [Blastococcus xanthinilyticus]